MKTEIEIPVSELKSVLPGLGKIVPRSSSLPVLGCIQVSLDPQRQFISLQANDLDQIATVRLENKAHGLPGALLVPLDMFSKLIKGCSADQTIRLIGGNEETKIRYTVAGSQVERLLSHIPTEEWPPAKVITEEPITLDDAFKQALKEAMECASADSSRYILNGACLDIRNKEAHYVVGTDGRHLYSANSFAFGLPESLIVPVAKFVTWPGFVNDGPWKLRMLPGIKVDPEDKKADKSKEAPPWLQIESDHWTYIAKAIDGQFPNWKQVAPVTNSKWTVVNLASAAVQAILEALPLLPGADDTNQPVVLDVTDTGIVLKARGRDQKDDTRVPIIEVTVTGKPVETSVNRVYLGKALRFGLNTIQIEDPLSPVLFSNGGRTMIVMPLRGEAATAQQEAQKQPPPPAENASAATLSATQAEQPTETTTERTTTMNASTAKPPGRGQLNGTARKNEDADSALGAVMEKIDSIKAGLRQAITDLTETQNLIKAAAKEKKATEKEVESVRTALRSLQKVEI